MTLPFLLVRLRITDCTIELSADFGFCGLQEERVNLDILVKSSLNIHILSLKLACLTSDSYCLG